MGIFDKTCPQCMATNSAATMRCTCGYLFNSADGDQKKLTLEVVAREEKLFEEYLEARVAQAIEAASIAARTALLEPHNDRRATEILRTKRAVEAAKIELDAQRVKAAKAAADAASIQTERQQAPSPSAPQGAPVNGLEATDDTSDSHLYREYLAARAVQAAKPAAANRVRTTEAPAIHRKTPGKVFRRAQVAKAAQAIQAAESKKTMYCPWCNRKIASRVGRCLCGWSRTIRLDTAISSPDTALSLFDKICPKCWTLVSLAAKKCTCGHLFEFSHTEESRTESERTLRKDNGQDHFVNGTGPAPRNNGAKRRTRKMPERARSAGMAAQLEVHSQARNAKVYKYYLEARATEAAETARVATQAAAIEPNDLMKAQNATRTQRVAKAAKAALNAQRMRLVRAAQVARNARAMQIAEAWPSAIVIGATKIAKTIFGVAVRTATDVVGTAKDRGETEPPMPAKPVVAKGLYERTVSQAIEHAHAGRTKRRRAAAAQAKAATSASSSTAARRRSPDQSSKRYNPPATDNSQRAAPRATQSAQPKQSRQAGAVFRATQAARIARAVTAARALEAADRTRQAAEAGELEPSIECPVCTALLPADATNCSCGWLVPAGQRDLPVLRTTDEHADHAGTLDCPMECPACTGTIPVGASRCSCGWLVPKGEREMPMLVLSPDERAAIEQDIDIKNKKT